VGKTTLCKRLIIELEAKGYPVIHQHFGLLPNNWDYYWDYLKFMNMRTVMDRFIMSEIVYGLIIRNNAKTSPEVYKLLDAHLRLQGSVTVVVTANDAWLRKQLDEKYSGRDEMYKPQQILDVNRGFQDLTKTNTIRGVKYACDFDFVYEVDDRSPMPSSCDELVRMIVAKYAERVELIEKLNTDDAIDVTTMIDTVRRLRRER